MEKLIILSIVLVSFAVPMWFATKAQPRRALARVRSIIFVFIIIWAYLCLHLYPRWVPIQ